MPNEAAELRSPARADRDVVAREDVDRIVDGGDVAGRVHIDDRGGTEDWESRPTPSEVMSPDWLMILRPAPKLRTEMPKPPPPVAMMLNGPVALLRVMGPPTRKMKMPGMLEFGAMLVVSVLMSKVSRGGPRATPSDLVAGAGDVRGADAGAGVWPGLGGRYHGQRQRTGSSGAESATRRAARTEGVFVG